MGILGKKYKSKYDDPKYLKSIGASEEFDTRDSGIRILPIGGIGILGATGMLLSKEQEKSIHRRKKRKEKEEKQKKQKQSMTSDKAYSTKKNKFFGHTDNTKLQEKPVAKKKRKKRTIQDVIEDIRTLHEKEEDLLMELEEKADDLDTNEGED